MTWYRPVSTYQLLNLKQMYPEAKVRICIFHYQDKSLFNNDLIYR